MQDWTSPSGSRWEPAAPPTARVTPPVGREPVDPGPRRRYRRPVVAVLMTLLVSGADGHGGPQGHDHHGSLS